MGPFVRVDTAFTEKGAVSVHYDPMIAKISVWGQTREEAIARMRVALDETRVEPPLNIDGTQKGSLRTNIEFLRKLCRNADVLNGNTTTDLIQRNPDLTTRMEGELPIEALIALGVYQSLQGDETENCTHSPQESQPIWSQRARLESMRGGL
jgi:acetyl/propionyl-CoA carboxylase alpha subunit